MGLTNNLGRLADALTADASLNVGLGVTPSAWSVTALQVKSAAIFEYSNNNISFGSNIYFDGSNRYISSTSASNYQQTGGAHYWYNAPSGTAGAAISFTQAMTLAANGNLLVGTTVDSGYKLDVNGTGRFITTLTNPALKITLTANSNATVLSTIDSSGYGWEFQQEEILTGDFRIFRSVASTKSQVLNIARSTGAATFSNSVTAASYGYAVGGFKLKEYANASSRNWVIGNDYLVFGDFAILQSTTQTGSAYTVPFYINSTGQLRFTNYTSTSAFTGTAVGYLGFDASGNILSSAAPAGGSMAIGGAITSATAGSVLFAGTSGVLAQNNANFFWDNTNTRLGIGTTGPAAKLHVNGGATAGVRITNAYLHVSADATFYLPSTFHELNSPSGTVLIVRSSGATPAGVFVIYDAASPNGTGNSFYRGLDSTATRFELRSNGGLANFQANNVNLSDARTKKDIIPLESYWNKFKAIEIVKFKYKDQTHDDFNIGLIAQQLESIAPEFVDIDGWDDEDRKNDEPLKSVYTADLYHATIKVLQEAMIKIEDQENRIKYLESLIVKN